MNYIHMDKFPLQIRFGTIFYSKYKRTKNDGGEKKCYEYFSVMGL